MIKVSQSLNIMMHFNDALNVMLVLNLWCFLCGGVNGNIGCYMGGDIGGDVF